MLSSNSDYLVSLLKEEGVLRSPAIEDALREIDRRLFVKDCMKPLAYFDEALPIGYGQTISQPYVVVFCLELLNVQPGNSVLEAGSGSGWQTALLAHLVGKAGKVFAFERISELCESGKRNLSHYSELAGRARFFCEDASAGLPEVEKRGGFDRILCAASVNDIPPAWRSQLKIGGTMVYPSKGSLFCEKKKGATSFEKDSFPGFVFVPFISKSTDNP